MTVIIPIIRSGLNLKYSKNGNILFILRRIIHLASNVNSLLKVLKDMCHEQHINSISKNSKKKIHLLLQIYIIFFPFLTIEMTRCISVKRTV